MPGASPKLAVCVSSTVESLASNVPPLTPPAVVLPLYLYLVESIINQSCEASDTPISLTKNQLGLKPN